MAAAKNRKRRPGERHGIGRDYCRKRRLVQSLVDRRRLDFEPDRRPRLHQCLRRRRFPETRGGGAWIRPRRNLDGDWAFQRGDGAGDAILWLARGPHGCAPDVAVVDYAICAGDRGLSAAHAIDRRADAAVRNLGARGNGSDPYRLFQGDHRLVRSATWFGVGLGTRRRRFGNHTDPATLQCAGAKFRLADRLCRPGNYHLCFGLLAGRDIRARAAGAQRRQAFAGGRARYRFR